MLLITLFYLYFCFKKNLKLLQTAMVAFRSLLVISYEVSGWNGSDALAEEVNSEYKLRYNWSLKTRDLVISCKYFCSRSNNHIKSKS
jgi:hypothetical protein